MNEEFGIAPPERGVTDQAVDEPKALRLARYLREFVGLRSTTVLDVEKYESVLWFADLPQEPECTSPAWHDDFEEGDSWLEVRKQHFPRMPEPPAIERESGAAYGC